MGLAGTRLAWQHGKFWYRHRSGKWEDVGTDVARAKERAALYNDPTGEYGTTGYWLRMFLVDCEARVKAKTLAQRTLDDYTKAVEELKVFFGKLLPFTIEPHHIQTYLTEGQRAGRAVPSNREIACLSSCLSWLIRTGKVPMRVNPCMRESGVKKNSERRRERYVTHAEYRGVFACAPPPVKLMMELTYRTLQRPESDILYWTPANVQQKDGGEVLRFTQNKTHARLDIALTGQLGMLVHAAMGDKPNDERPLVCTRKGGVYTYSGITAMLTYAQNKARKKFPALADMASFGFRDLKGKGATDLWRAGEQLERIQQLCGHANKTTTETYVKARWTETASPNPLEIAML
ncbi:integrase [Candidimonas nitroreducens]|uniref:Integrase n=1 Tax=Candidimonas nitroreducens TaxID=683354 RepID=A0A225M1V1_9BURK|nr:integrase [Candidimonas nitroreducens]